MFVEIQHKGLRPRRSSDAWQDYIRQTGTKSINRDLPQNLRSRWSLANYHDLVLHDQTAWSAYHNLRGFVVITSDNENKNV